jgi:hypothetical protein
MPPKSTGIGRKPAAAARVLRTGREGRFGERRGGKREEELRREPAVLSPMDKEVGRRRWEPVPGGEAAVATSAYDRPLHSRPTTK